MDLCQANKKAPLRSLVKSGKVPFLDLQRAACHTAIQLLTRLMDRLGAWLNSFLIYTKPFSSVSAPRQGGAAEHIARQLDARLREHLGARQNLFSEAAPALAASLARPLLCLFDRNFELSVVRPCCVRSAKPSPDCASWLRDMCNKLSCLSVRVLVTHRCHMVLNLIRNINMWPKLAHMLRTQHFTPHTRVSCHLNAS